MFEILNKLELPSNIVSKVLPNLLTCPLLKNVFKRMEKNIKIKDTLKLLIGVSEIDGEIKPEARKFLFKIAHENHLTDDPEIKALLYGFRKVKPAECYDWLETYLERNPTPEDYLSLLEVISRLIYSDNHIANSEAKLLTKLETLDPKNHPHTLLAKIVKLIRKFYQDAIKESS